MSTIRQQLDELAKQRQAKAQQFEQVFLENERLITDIIEHDINQYATSYAKQQCQVPGWDVVVSNMSRWYAKEYLASDQIMACMFYSFAVNAIPLDANTIAQAIMTCAVHHVTADLDLIYFDAGSDFDHRATENLDTILNERESL